MELQRHHDGNKLVILNEHYSSLFSLLTSLDNSLLLALFFLSSDPHSPAIALSSGVFKCFL